MAVCEYCGSPLPGDAKFCTSCGAPAPAPRAGSAGYQASSASAPNSSNTSSYGGNPYTNVFSGTTPAANYDIILISRGSCPANVCGDILEDTLGYTNYQSARLVAAAPVKVARNMGRRQARVVAQALAEYGVRVAVVDQYGRYVDLVNEATASVYNSRTGAFLASTIAVLVTLDASNRVTDYSTVVVPGIGEYYFRMLFAPVPPMHVRRPRPASQPQPAPRPQPKPVQPKPVQQRPPVSQPRPAAQQPVRPGTASGQGRPASQQRPAQQNPSASQSRPQGQPRPVQRPDSPHPGGTPGSRPGNAPGGPRRPK